MSQIEWETIEIRGFKKLEISHPCPAQASAKVSVGGSASLALGPLGRTGEANALVSETGRTTQQTSYSHSRGFFGGVTVDGAYVSVRKDVNQAYYGQSHSAEALLTDTSIPHRRRAPPKRCAQRRTAAARR